MPTLWKNLHPLTHKLNSFGREPAFVRLWFLPAWVLLGISKLMIVLVTFRRLAPHLGQHNGAVALTPLLDHKNEDRAHQISRVIKMAAAYTPWDSNCFPQAVTARLLLGFYKVPYILCFGLSRHREAGVMDAHAWVVSGRVNVTGGQGFENHTVVGTFLSPLLDDLREH